MNLWEQDACELWDAALAEYPRTLEVHGGERLLALDRWCHDDLPTAVRERQPAHLTHDELVQLVRWKMGRGIWRPNNLQLAESNADEDVVAATGDGLAAVPDLLGPVRAIARLRGVGAATASAVLAAIYPEHYPFLEDVIAAQIPTLGPPAFTPRYYVAYASAIRDRAAALATACPHQQWTPHAVDLALWAQSTGA